MSRSRSLSSEQLSQLLRGRDVSKKFIGKIDCEPTWESLFIELVQATREDSATKAANAWLELQARAGPW